MGVTTTKTNKPLNPRGNDQSPLAFNRAKLYSGKALDFDGVNDEVSGSASTLPANNYTIVSWFNLDTLKASGIVWWGTDTNGQRRAMLIWNGGSGSDWFLSADGYATNVKGSTPLETGRWYFGAVSVDSSNNVKVYLNAQEDGSGILNLNSYTGTTYNIGKTAQPAEVTDGEISGTRVFNQVLTAAQVADLYNNPEKVVPTGVDNTALKLWLPMMEGAGTTAYDGSGNGNHGTISGATYVNGIGAPVAQSAVMDWNKGVNLLPYSEQFDQWSLFTGATTSANTTTAPDGQTTADTLNFASGNESLIYWNYGSGSATFTSSIWAKSSTGKKFTFRHWNGTSAIRSSEFTTTSEWQRFDFTFTDPLVNIGICNEDNGNTGSIQIWGFQLEQASSVGPYVRTGATAQTSDVLLPQGLTTGRDITGVNLFENVRKQGALNLDGNSWAEVHDNASLDVTTAITLEAWVYLDSAPIDNVDSMSSIMTKKSANVTDSEAAFDVRATGSNGSIAIAGGFDTGALQTINIATGLSIDQWYHIGITYDSGSVVTYLNGAQVNTGSMLSPIIANAYDVWIGRHVNAGGLNSYAPADIAQPRIYNRALTAEEVARNYDAGKNTYTN